MNSKMNKQQIQDIRIGDFFYNLPDDRIAKYPLKKRDECKLLSFKDDNITDKIFKELPSLLPENILLIYNSSRVINARINFRKGEDEKGAKIEIFCLEPVKPEDYALSFASQDGCEWKCFVGNSKRWKKGTILSKNINFLGKEIILKAERMSQHEGYSIIRFQWDNRDFSFSEIIEQVGVIPIPPYLNRETENTDKEDYQTVYSRAEGSVAAPTAGLHFTNELLKDMSERGMALREVTLHVGAGTFQPVNCEKIGEHEMHREFFSINKKLIEELISIKKANSKPIIAVGTTSVRVLESLYYIGCLIIHNQWEGVLPQWYAYSDEKPDVTLTDSLEAILRSCKSNEFVGETRLLIAPGFKFNIIDGMITNFHQPGSTLLLLVSAFLGKDKNGEENWRKVYNHALDKDYRFLSYGDACLFLK